jgi:hypothetical protein
MSNDVATVDQSQSPAMKWWSDPNTDEVEGYDLVKEDALLSLVGVPFMITSVTFRDGIQSKERPYRDDYVSLELTVAPPAVLTETADRIASRRKTYDLPLIGMARAEEQLVINDGSTGIYRQITQYLSAKGLILLPPGEEEGEKGETVYDLPRSNWESGADEATSGIDIKLRCSRGLRFSDYDNPYGPDKARTWYIA